MLFTALVNSKVASRMTCVGRIRRQSVSRAQHRTLKERKKWTKSSGKPASWKNNTRNKAINPNKRGKKH